MRTMKRLAFCALGLCVLSATALAAPKSKKYHFELIALTPKPEVKPDVAKIAQPRVQAQVTKAFESNPQLVAVLEGAPDAKNADAYRKFLVQKGVSGSYLVTVEITEASETIEPISDKPNTQRLDVHIAIHMLGETVPGRTMGFTGDGQATVKQEVGMKIRDKDRDYAWDSAAEVAVGDALKTCFVQLDKPAKKQ